MLVFLNINKIVKVMIVIFSNVFFLKSNSLNKKTKLNGESHQLLLHWLRVHESSGYTLIEVLVVVIILGILSAITIPITSQQISKSRQVEAVLNVNACLKRQQSYYTESSIFANTIQQLELPAETHNFIYRVDVFPPTAGENGSQTIACCAAAQKGGERAMLFQCLTN
jgi:prepilin-type N-terminal cleavage/methylation domain-containing protein